MLPVAYGHKGGEVCVSLKLSRNLPSHKITLTLGSSISQMSISNGLVFYMSEIRNLEPDQQLIVTNVCN